MRHEVTIDIAAPPFYVWEVLCDVDNWPRWTASVTYAEKLSDGPLGVNSRVRISQPNIPTAIWTVRVFEPGTYFEWDSASTVLNNLAGHRVEAAGEGSRVTLHVDQTGFTVLVMGWWIKRTTLRYLQMEAEGLKAFCERPPNPGL